MYEGVKEKDDDFNAIREQFEDVSDEELQSIIENLKQVETTA